MTSTSASGSAGALGPSRAYSNYVLGLMFLVAGLNVADRYIFGMLLMSIKQEFDASDTQLGLLMGFGYAVFYCAAGIPVARWADRGVRRSIVALGLLMWSGLTLAQGFALNLTQLFVARIGVGVGEAAGTPPSHSLISDYFPPARRATALGVTGVGAGVGMMSAYLAGGWINELFGWRAVMITFGVPGILLAIVIRFTLREPPRGRFDPESSRGQYRFSQAIGFLARSRSYRHLIFGVSLRSFAFAGATTWYPTFLMRVHDLSSGEAGSVLALMSVLAPVGVYIGGRATDALGARDVRWYMGVPALAILCYTPFAIGFLFIPGTLAALVCLAPALFCLGAGSAGTNASIMGVAKPAMRALAAAIKLLATGLLGTGLGPTVSGLLNDLLSGVVAGESIRYSLAIVALAGVWSAVHKGISARALSADLDLHATR